MLDIKQLRKTPKKYVKNLSDNQLVSIIKKARIRYYDEGKEWISDSVYDVVHDRLQKINPEHPILYSGETTETDKIEKVLLKYSMPSLDKIKPDGSCKKWLAKNEGIYVVSDKLDGISLQLISSKSGWKLFTKGSTGGGNYGKDISHLSSGLNLPKPCNIDIRAEMIISPDNFKKAKKLLKRDYSNPRNFISSMTTKLKVNKQVLSLIDIICYEVLNQDMKPSDQFQHLESLGFKIPAYKVFQVLDEEKLSSILERRKERCCYELDGIVITINDHYKRPRSKNPKYSKAFKLDSEDNAVTVKVNEVIWEKSKQRLFKPVITFDPVEIGGVTIQRATGHNAFFIKNGFSYKDKDKNLDKNIRPIGAGAIIKVVRSGDVIPKVIAVITPAKKPQFPDQEFFWNDNGVEIFSKKTDQDVEIKLITSFFKRIGVENFSEGLITVLYKEGYDSIDKIVKIKKSDLVSIHGIKKKTADKIVDGIKEALIGIEINVLMASSELFKDLKEDRIKLVTSIYPDIYKEIDADTVKTKVVAIKGLSLKLATNFSKGIKPFRRFLKSIKGRYSIAAPVSKNDVKGFKLKGKTVCFTGFRDDSIKKLLESGDCKITNTVSKNTDILVVKDSDYVSTKIDKANELSIKVLTKDEFVDNYLLVFKDK